MNILRTSILGGAFLIVVVPICAFCSEPDKTQQIIAASKAATGGAGWDQVKSWHETGTLTTGGLSGDYESWSDFPNLRSAETYKLGPTKGSDGWNGKESWSTDSNDQLRIESSEAAIADAVKSAYQEVRAFYFPDRYPAELKYAGVKVDDGKPCDVIVCKPNNSDPFEVWFDQSTHYPVRTVDLTGQQPQTTDFSDFRPIAGLTVAFHARTSIGDPKYDSIVQSAQIEVNQAIPATRFDPPKQVLDPLIYPSGKGLVSIPFKLINNHIYLQAVLDGKQYDHIIFDTGATNLLGAAAAKLNGIKAEGTLPGGGFGENVSAFGLAKIGLIEVGGIQLKDQVFAVFDLTNLSKVEGVEGDGLIGYEVARRAVITIDYANQVLTIMKPEAFHPSPKAVKVPFKFDGHIPTIEAEIDGVAGEFEIDTGSRASLSIMHPFAVTNGLIQKYQAKTEVIGGYGVGGPARALLVRPKSLKIGGVQIQNPVGLIELGDKGAAAATRTAGNLGGGVLKRFTVTLDYEHRVIYLEPNANFNEVDVFDRSGLWCMQDNSGGVSIVDVVKNSPAAKAGIHPGDRVAGIDGTPVTAAQIISLRNRLREAPGTKVSLQVVGRTGKRDVSLVLEDLG
jgi:hypothetical protein